MPVKLLGTAPAAPSTQAFSDAAAAGTSTSPALADHKHAMMSSPLGLPLGLTGATAAARFVGGTTGSTAPTTGTFAAGDFAVDQNGLIWVCSTGGTPGTWRPLAFVSGATPTASAPGDVGSAGSDTSGAARDHKHAREAFATPAVVLGTAGAAGAATTLIRSDATIAAFDATNPSTQAFGDAAAVGAAAFAARRDHKHAMMASPLGLPLALTGAVAATRYVGATSSGAPVTGTFALGDFIVDQTGKVWVCTVAGTQGTWVQIAGSAGGSSTTSAVGDSPVTGTATTWSPSDHKHGREGFATNTLALGTAAGAGAAATLIRSDATIAAFDTTAPTTSAVADAAAVGSAAFAARRDHVHGREGFGAVTAETTFGIASANGVAVTEARSDHTHGTPANPTGLPLALTGAVAATRYVGGTTTGAPITGTFAAGDLVISQAGAVLVCTVAGTPGTWVQLGVYNLAGVEDLGQIAMDLGTMPKGSSAATPTSGADVLAALNMSLDAMVGGISPAAPLGGVGLGGSNASASAVGDAATEGASANASRLDHKHGREAFATPAIVLGTAAAAGAAATPIRSDSTIVAFDATVPTTNAAGTLVAAAAGSAAVAARRDHVHGSAGALGTLGYAQATVDQTGITANVDLTSLAVTVTVATGRRIRISFKLSVENSNANGGSAVFIQEGASQLQTCRFLNPNANVSITAQGSVVLTPTAASHTYKLTMQNYVSGTAVSRAGSPEPAYILVEDIGT
jgi:hypothetical protein